MSLGSLLCRYGSLLCILSCLSVLTTVANGQAINITANSTTLFEALLDSCKGIVIRYALNPKVEKIIPFSNVNKTQPYKFIVDIDLTNAGYDELHAWELFIGFQYGEVIAEAPGVAFLDGSTTPGALVENGTTIVGLDTPDLLTSIATAEDLDLIAAKFNLTGTEFGVGPEQPIKFPLPKNISLVNAGYSCNPPLIDRNTTMLVCCPENRTALRSGTEENYLPRYTGDITMYFDVIKTMAKFYDAQVSINMDDPIGRLNHWNLTWDWRHGEFIYSMKGAETLEQQQDDCVKGPAGKLYPELDFSLVMSCQPTPSFVDLSPDRMADQMLVGCCRNGTLLPKVLDPVQSKSVFQLEVYKLLPNLARQILDPPVNWRIGNIREDDYSYVCDSPRLVSPSEFYTTGLHYSSAVKSWQVTCNKTVIPRKSPHKCCVSFSAYYNSSVVPCPTCACGCKQATMDPGNMTCNADPSVEAMLLPSYGLLLPPSNRTILASTLAVLEHYPQPDPMPCPDNCGASINWHVYSDYRKGFSARITLFNWKPEAVTPWFTVVEFSKATPGYENVYSFNGTLIPGVVSDRNGTKITGVDRDPNRTLIFMHGKDGYNGDLLGLDKGLIPGKLQSLMSFDKRKTPGIDVVNGDGFPSRVWFNGDECVLPDILPKSSAWRTVQVAGLPLLMSLVVALLGPLAVH